MFNTISKWFSGKNTAEPAAIGNDVVVYAPLSGQVLSLEELPDPTFAQKMLGDGMAIEPASRQVLAPFDGTVVTAFPTQHAIGLRSVAGLECLIHVGIDTVNLNGQGFRLLVEEGQTVRLGEPLIELDLDALRLSGKALSTPVIITNGDCWHVKQRSEEPTVSAGKELFVAQLR